MSTKYIHTIKGRAATFDGYQICYSTFSGKPNLLVDSLAQIKREQKITISNRRRDGFQVSPEDYSHRRYDTTPPEKEAE